MAKSIALHPNRIFCRAILICLLLQLLTGLYQGGKILGNLSPFSLTTLVRLTYFLNQDTSLLRLRRMLRRAKAAFQLGTLDLFRFSKPELSAMHGLQLILEVRVVSYPEIPPTTIGSVIPSVVDRFSRQRYQIKTAFRRLQCSRRRAAINRILRVSTMTVRNRAMRRSCGMRFRLSHIIL